LFQDEGEEESILEDSAISASGTETECVQIGPQAPVPDESLAPAPELEQIFQVATPQIGKHQKVQADLRLAMLQIPDYIRRKLIDVVKVALNAFAGSPPDVVRNLLVVHTIRTGKSHHFVTTSTDSLRAQAVMYM
jgi:hypothetical protein